MEWTNIFEFLERKIYEKYVYYYLIALYILVNVPFVTNYNISSLKSWMIAGSIALVFIIIACVIRATRKLPKFKKGQIGIIFSIDMQEKEHYSLLREKFVKPFQKKLRNESPNYKVVLVNNYIAEKINEDYVFSKKSRELCKKTRCKFLVYGSCVSGGEKESISCKLDLNSIIFHKSIPQINQFVLSKEMHLVFRPIRDIEILKETETSDLELTSKQLNFAFDYILASTFLVSSEINKALNVFLSILYDLQMCKINAPVINFIKHVINDRICFCYNKLASMEISSYYQDEDSIHLMKAEQNLAESQKYIKDSYDYKLMIAICYFMLHRDIKRALKSIEDCQCISTDDSWKFSRVFLKLYQNDCVSNFLNAYKVYNKSFISGRADFVFLNNLLDSILMVVKKEPEKKQMFFLLMLVYYYIGDKGEYNKYRDQFFDKYAELIKNENFKAIQLKLDGGDDVEWINSAA